MIRLSPAGRMAQQLTILAAFMSGIVGSKSSQLPSQLPRS